VNLFHVLWHDDGSTIPGTGRSGCAFTEPNTKLVNATLHRYAASLPRFRQISAMNLGRAALSQHRERLNRGGVNDD
jgi:hypothetical protein